MKQITWLLETAIGLMAAVTTTFAVGCHSNKNDAQPTEQQDNEHKDISHNTKGSTATIHDESAPQNEDIDIFQTIIDSQNASQNADSLEKKDNSIGLGNFETAIYGPPPQNTDSSSNAMDNAMNSMLANAAMMNMDELDWNSFDATNIDNDQYLTLMYGPTALYGPLALDTRERPSGSPKTIINNNAPNNAPEQKDLPTSNPPKITVKVTGGLDKRLIQKVVRQHLGELRVCKEKNSSDKEPNTIVVKWGISAMGDVTKVNVIKSEKKNKALESCFVNSIKLWKFPKAQNGKETSVEYTFI